MTHLPFDQFPYFFLIYSYESIWTINKNVSLFRLNNEQRENQHPIFHSALVVLLLSKRLKKLLNEWNPIVYFSDLISETKQTNVLSFSPHCKNIMRKLLYQSLKELHDIMIKQQQMNLPEINPHLLCLLHSNRN